MININNLLVDYTYEDYLFGDYQDPETRLANNIHRIDLVDIFSHNLAAIVPPFNYEPNE